MPSVICQGWHDLRRAFFSREGRISQKDIMFKFIHAADIHLDSPLRGLPTYEGAPVEEIREATRRALQNLVHVALDEEVDFLLIAGDVYDGDWKDHNTGLYFAKQMARLKGANVPVFLIAGNHDAQSVMTKRLQLPDNVHVFPTKKADTVHLESLGVAIHGQGFATKAVTKDLTASYPAAVPDAYNIGLLHTSLTGYEGHDSYAPCTIPGLVHLEYDYWALGHIHQQECLRDHAPAIWYSGNIQGRHIRETGPKGCLVVEVDDRDEHQVRFEPLDVVRWVELSIDVAECGDLSACVDVFTAKLAAALEQADDRMLAVRVVYTGTSAAHESLLAHTVQLHNEIRNVANIHGGDQVYIEKVKVRTRPQQERAVGGDDTGPLGMLDAVVGDLSQDADAEARLAALLDPLRVKLPAEITGPDFDLTLADPAVLKALLDDSTPIIRSLWHDEEAGP